MRETLIKVLAVVKGIPTPFKVNFMVALIMGCSDIELIYMLLLIMLIVSVPKLWISI